MGGGDIKLLGMIGAFCGIKGVIFSLMGSYCVGSIVGIPLMLVKGQDTKYALPFGPFLLPAPFTLCPRRRRAGAPVIRFYFKVKAPWVAGNVRKGKGHTEGAGAGPSRRRTPVGA